MNETLGATLEVGEAWLAQYVSLAGASLSRPRADVLIGAVIKTIAVIAMKLGGSKRPEVACAGCGLQWPARRCRPRVALGQQWAALERPKLAKRPSEAHARLSGGRALAHTPPGRDRRRQSERLGQRQSVR